MILKYSKAQPILIDGDDFFGSNFLTLATVWNSIARLRMDEELFGG